jgi:hypothetical protein
LKGKHSADLTTIKNIEEQGFNDVVLMVSKGDLVTFQLLGQTEEPLSPLPRAEETGILSIFRAICSSPNLGEFDVIGEVLGFKKTLQDFSMSRVKTQVDMNRDQFIIDGYPIPSFLKEAEERKAILPPGDPY